MPQALYSQLRDAAKTHPDISDLLLRVATILEQGRTGPPRLPPERIFDTIRETESGCWEFQGSLGKNGYGKTRYRGKMISTHRLAYILRKGPIPEGMHVRHTCDNRPCINPAHLILGTPAENVRDRQERGRHWVRSGETHPNTRLSDDQVRDIRRLYDSGVPPREIAKIHPVSRMYAYRLGTRRDRKTVGD